MPCNSTWILNRIFKISNMDHMHISGTIKPSPVILSQTK